MHDNDTRELHELMTRSVDHVRPHITQLQAAARDDGRRLLQARRRKSAALTLAAAAVLAVAVPVGLRAGLAGSRGEPSEASTPTLPVAAGGGDTSQIVVGPEDVPSRSTVFESPRLFSAVAPGPRNLLPDGAFLIGSTSLSARLVNGYATTYSRILRPGVGAGIVRVSEKSDAPPPACSRPAHATTVDCRVLTGPDGDEVGTATSTTFGALEVREVVIELPTGGRSAIAVANTDARTWGPNTPALDTKPPLSLDELITIASTATTTAVSKP